MSDRDELLAEIERLRLRVEDLEYQLDSARAYSRLNPLRWFKRQRASAGKDIEQPFALLVESSEYFDADFYLEQLRAKFAEEEPIARQNPARHYLAFGHDHDLNPSEAFDSAWYLSEYPDVARADMNPLLHFLQHGEKEGRLPKPFEGGVPVGNSRLLVEYFREKLWGGYSQQALVELQRVSEEASPSVRKKALWYMARWYYAHGEVDFAQRLIEKGLGLSSRISKQQLLGLVKCLTVLERRDELNELLDDHELIAAASNELPYIKANSADRATGSESALSFINEIFAASGLVAITRRDRQHPLALGNLSWAKKADAQMDVASSPKISVVIPAFNAERTIHIALDSLLEQTWQHIEVIVVDDCSTDNTVKVVQGYVEKDPRVRLIQHEYNQGAYPARNTGMRLATGDYLTVHDSDDWSHPQKLEKLAKALQAAPDKMASVSYWVRAKMDLSFVGSWFLNETFVEKNHSSTLFRRRVVDEIGYWDPVSVAGDTEFLWRLEQRYGSDAVVEVLRTTPLSIALADDNSLTRTKATHVKTIHYGLRRLYREAARWWHKSTATPKLDSTKRLFPAPLGNLRGGPQRFDWVVVADFSEENTQLPSLLSELKVLLANESNSVCLLHWPSYEGWGGGSIADDVFALCIEHQLQFVHPGIEINAQKLWFTDISLWHHSLDAVPVINGIENVRMESSSKHDSLPSEQAIKEYFAKGSII